MMLPHILAVYCGLARQSRSRAGLWSGIAFLFHTKGAFVLAMCALLCWRGLLPLLAGFLIPNSRPVRRAGSHRRATRIRAPGLAMGLRYAANSPVPDPLLNGLRRTADWLGFHAAW